MCPLSGRDKSTCHGVQSRALGNVARRLQSMLAEKWDFCRFMNHIAQLEIFEKS